MHEEFQPAAMTRDAAHVETLIRHIKSSMTNPFYVTAHPGVLFNIATSLHASLHVQSTLPNGLTKGQKMMESFLEQCMSEGQEKCYHAPISMSKIVTFADCNSHNKEGRAPGTMTMNAIISPEIVFQHVLTLTEVQNDVTAESVFSHPVGSVPSALFHDDGSIRKTKRSNCGEVLEGLVSKQTQLPPFDKDIYVFIREAMGIIQTMNGNNFNTFGQLGQNYLQYLLNGF